MNKEECNIFKCPIAVSMMTDEEKRFYGVKEEK